MKRANKIALLTLLSVMAVALISIRPSAGTASPLVSPLPCAPDVTLPGSVCWVYPPDSSAQSVRPWRVWLPISAR